MVRVGRLAQMLEVLKRITHQPFIERAEVRARMAERVCAGGVPKIPTDESEIEAIVVADEEGAALDVVPQPARERFHNHLRLVEAKRFLAREAGDREGLGDPSIGNRLQATVEGLLEALIYHDRTKTDHAVVPRNRPVRLDIHHDVGHDLPLPAVPARARYNGQLWAPFDGLDEAGRGGHPSLERGAVAVVRAVMREIASRVPGPGCAVLARTMVKTCKVGEGSGPDAAAELVRRLADPAAKPHQRCRASDAAAAGATVRVGCPTYHADEREPLARVLEHWSAGIAAAGAETRHFAAGGGIGEPKLTAGRVAHHHQRGRAERAIAAGGHHAHAITGHDEAVAERKVIACAERRRRHPRTHGRGKLDQG